MATLGQKAVGADLTIPAAGGPMTQGAQAPNVGGGAPGVSAVESSPPQRTSLGGAAMFGETMQMFEGIRERKWREKMYDIERGHMKEDRTHAETRADKLLEDEKKYEENINTRNVRQQQEQAKFLAKMQHDAAIATQLTESMNQWREAQKMYAEQTVAQTMALASDPNIPTETLVRLIGAAHNGYYPSAAAELDALERTKLVLGLDPESTLSGPVYNRYSAALSQEIGEERMAPPAPRTDGQFGPEAPEDALWEDFKSSGTVSLDAVARMNVLRLSVLSRAKSAKTAEEKRQVNEAFLEGVSNLTAKSEQFKKSIDPFVRLVSGLGLSDKALEKGEVPLDSRARAKSAEFITSVFNNIYTGAQGTKDSDIELALANYFGPLDDRVGGEPLAKQILAHLSDPEKNPLDPAVKASAGLALMHLSRAMANEFAAQQGRPKKEGPGLIMGRDTTAVWANLSPDQQKAARTRVNELAATFESAGLQMTASMSTNEQVVQLINEMLSKGNNEAALGQLGAGMSSRDLVNMKFKDLAKAFEFRGEAFLNPKTASSFPQRIQQEISRLNPNALYKGYVPTNPTMGPSIGPQEAFRQLSASNEPPINTAQNVGAYEDSLIPDIRKETVARSALKGKKEQIEDGLNQAMDTSVDNERQMYIDDYYDKKKKKKKERD